MFKEIVQKRLARMETFRSRAQFVPKVCNGRTDRHGPPSALALIVPPSWVHVPSTVSLLWFTVCYLHVVNGGVGIKMTL